MNDDASAQKKIDGTRFVIWVLWGAFFASIGACAIFLWLGRPVSYQRLNDAFSNTMGIIALVTIIASLVARPLFFGGFRRGTLSLNSPQALKRLLLGNMVCFGSGELLGVWGLFLGIRGYPLDYCVQFFAAAVVLILWHMPLASRFSPAS
jgi:hypothetical protein